jgi:thiamine-monophosphate kinase
VRAAAAEANVAVARIGRVDAAPGLRLHDAHGQPLLQDFAGFDHFRA